MKGWMRVALYGLVGAVVAALFSAAAFALAGDSFGPADEIGPPAVAGADAGRSVQGDPSGDHTRSASLGPGDRTPGDDRSGRAGSSGSGGGASGSGSGSGGGGDDNSGSGSGSDNSGSGGGDDNSGSGGGGDDDSGSGGDDD